MSEIKTYKVFTWRLANKLRQCGFRPVGKALNYKNPTQDVILFEDTPALRKAINEILNNRK